MAAINDLDIENIGTVSGTPIALQAQNTVYVQKNPGTNEFSSIKAAVDSIVTASSSNIFQVKVGPGIFVEDTITMKPYVFIQGYRNSTIIRVNATSKDVIIGVANSEIHECTIDGATDANKAAIRVSNTIGGLFTVRECLFGSSNSFVIVDAAVFGQITILDCMVLSSAIFVKGFHIGGSGMNIAAVIGFNALIPSGLTVGDMFLIDTPNATLNISSCAVIGAGGTLTNAIRAVNGGSVSGQAVAFLGATNAIVTDNAGSAPSIQLGSTTIISAVSNDLLINHPGTTGFITGAMDTSKIAIAAGSTLSVAYADPTTNGGYGVIGELLQGDDRDKLANISKLLRTATALGHFSGGVLTDGGGLTIDVTAGEGFIEDGLGVVREVIWNAVSGLVLTAKSSIVTVDSSGTVQAQTGLPDTVKKIILGGVVAENGGIAGLSSVPLEATHLSNKTEEALIIGLGPLYVSGSLVSEKNIGSRDLVTTNGSYFVGSNPINPTGSDPTTWTSFRSDGSGGHTTATQSVVDNANYDDGAGNLTAITAGDYVKHAFYVVGSNSDTGYFLIYGLQVFNSLSAAETGPLPSNPGYFDVNVVPIASFVVQQGNNQIVEILDERPKLTKTASAISSSSDHGNLSGLSDDDHLQYFKADGTRTATGNFNLGTNSITNVGTVDGVIISSHASRHLPNGADPLTTAAPSASLSATTTNAVGISNSMSRSDHSHDMLTGVPSTQTPNQTNVEGVSANLSRADHIHTIATAIAVNTGAANTEGTSNSFSRADHVHDTIVGNSQVTSVTDFIDLVGGGFSVITGMTITPAAGTYSVSFSSTVQNDNNSGNYTFQISIAGVSVTHSVRSHLQGGTQTANVGRSIHTQAIVTVNGAQAIATEMDTAVGTTIVHQRSMILIRLS